MHGLVSSVVQGSFAGDDSFPGLESLTLIALSCNPKLAPAGQHTAKHDGLCPLLSVSLMVVYNHWTGLVDWTGGLDWWTELVDWTGGLDWWTGLVDWTGGLNWWTGLVDWTGGLDWWTGLKIIFMLINEKSPYMIGFGDIAAFLHRL